MSAPVLPGFQFLKHLGSGGFADVFLYEQLWPRQRVAVKVVRPDVPLNDREKGLFAAEANAMALLADHPYIVSVLTAGITADGRPFMVMRYCPPPDLGVRVRTQPLSPIDAVSVGIKLASAIETAHRSGILHRDIKPSNVLITTYHEPALTDFGIAGHISEVASDQDVRISYPWSPPELLDGRSNGSVASDVYSLGATIWHLLVGRSPFSVPGGDNSTRALTARILHSPPPSTQRPDVPGPLDRLLQTCLAKDPSLRPPSAMDLIVALQRIEAELGAPHTAAAVEAFAGPATPGHPGSTGRPAAPPAQAEDDDTVLKAPTVISASAPRTLVSPIGLEAPARSGKTFALWAALGALLVIAVIGWLTTRGGAPAEEPLDQPTPPTSAPPLVPEPMDVAPILDATRTGDKVVFTWAAPDGALPGDVWVVGRDATVRRTPHTRLRVRSATEVCLSVALLRDGETGPAADLCE